MTKNLRTCDRIDCSELLGLSLSAVGSMRISE